MAAMLQNLPAMQRDFGGLLGTMQQNVGIFSQVPAGLLERTSTKQRKIGAGGYRASALALASGDKMAVVR